MIEAKELRLGNIVNKNYRVVEIDTSGCGLVDNNNPDDIASYIYLCYKNIKPIPLTEEWLLRFGFEKPLNSSWCVKGEIELDLDKGIKYFIFGNLKHVELKHVHQLQNLFYALTGEELTIKEEVNG